MNLSREYRESAGLLAGRIEELRGNAENGEIAEEERIMLLEAEYYYLLRTASHLEEYYSEASQGKEVAV